VTADDDIEITGFSIMQDGTFEPDGFRRPPKGWIRMGLEAVCSEPCKEKKENER
jgi:hypothetical protein